MVIIYTTTFPNTKLCIIWTRCVVITMVNIYFPHDLESVGVIKWNWDSFSPSTSVSPVSIIPPVLHTQLNLRCSYQKDKLANAGNFPKSSALLEIGELWTEKQCHFFVLRVGQWHSSWTWRPGARRPARYPSLVPFLHKVSFPSTPRAPPPCPAHPPPPAGSCATDHLHYDLVMNGKRGSTPWLTVTDTPNVTLTVTSTWSCWAERAEQLVI